MFKSYSLFFVLIFCYSSMVLATESDVAYSKCIKGEYQYCGVVNISNPEAKKAYELGCTNGNIESCLLVKLLAKNTQEEKRIDDILKDVCKKNSRALTAGQAIGDTDFWGRNFEKICANFAWNAYENSTKKETLKFRKVNFPFKAGTKFYVHQGAFGVYSHYIFPSLFYSYDMDVPFGTEIVAIEPGTVIEVYEPNKGGGCEMKWANFTHRIRIQNSDETVTEYRHVISRVKEGQKVVTGEVVGVTDNNGYICDQPHLHFQVTNPKIDHENKKQTIPLYFKGIKGGLLKEGSFYVVKK